MLSKASKALFGRRGHASSALWVLAPPSVVRLPVVCQVFPANKSRSGPAARLGAAGPGGALPVLGPVLASLRSSLRSGWPRRAGTPPVGPPGLRSCGPGCPSACRVATLSSGGAGEACGQQVPRVLPYAPMQTCYGITSARGFRCSPGVPGRYGEYPSALRSGSPRTSRLTRWPVFPHTPSREHRNPTHRGPSRTTAKAALPPNFAGEAAPFGGNAHTPAT